MSHMETSHIAANQDQSIAAHSSYLQYQYVSRQTLLSHMQSMPANVGLHSQST